MQRFVLICEHAEVSIVIWQCKGMHAPHPHKIFQPLLQQTGRLKLLVEA